MTDFDMPATGPWEVRGGWVVTALAKEFLLTREQAAGIVGNLGFESIGFTKLHEIGQPEGVGGYGWGQWTAARRRTFLAWCTKAGLEWQSDQANYGYLCNELHTTHAYCIKALRQELTLDRCVFEFGRLFEAPGGTTDTFLPGNAGRLSYAKRALAGARAVAGPSVADASPPAPGLADNPIEHLRQAQRLLGFTGDDVDGDPGPLTRAAAARYRAAHPDA